MAAREAEIAAARAKDALAASQPTPQPKKEEKAEEEAPKKAPAKKAEKKEEANDDLFEVEEDDDDLF